MTMDIRAIRQSLGMTQREFADAIGVDEAAVYKYEHGISKPSKKRIDRIDELLRTNGDDYSVIEITSNINHQGRVMDDYMRRLVILGANGCCELCGKAASLSDKDGHPFLCMYIVNNQNLKVDITKRCVALCPECLATTRILADEKTIKFLKEKAAGHNY